MLELRGIDAHYGGTQVLWNVSLSVGEGEVVAVMGPNGSGKSTVLKAAIGLVRPTAGRVVFAGEDITALPAHDMAARGLGLVLERRRLFPAMSVHENLLMGAYHKEARRRRAETLAFVESLFPRLAERRAQQAGRMSGGEQQMVAIARGLMSRPRLLMLDEPFLGLTPRMTRETIRIIRGIAESGVAVLFNEQNVRVSFGNADRGYLLESGRMVLEGSGMEMLAHPAVRRVYLGEHPA